MGFIALVALTCALVPLFFAIDQRPGVWLAGVQWLVVALFLVEYVAGLVQAESRKDYMLQPMRLLVAATIVIAFASLLDSVPNSFVAAPSLNIFRVVLAAIFGLQAGALTVGQYGVLAEQAASPSKEVFIFDDAGRVRESSWLELLRWSEEPTAAWYHAENITVTDLPEIAGKWKAPLPVLQACLGSENYPRVEFFHETLLLSVWLRGEEGSAAPVVLLVHGQAVLSISRSTTSLVQRIEKQETEIITPEMHFSSRMVLSVLELALKSGEVRINSCETHLREMERVPVGKAKPTLFTQAYGIKQELAALYSDLWRLKGAVRRLEEGKVKLAGTAGAFDRLERHIEFLYTTVDNLRDGVISLIELHMNNASFEMTKFMRLLAVVNVIALIPAVIGGLLGMNILGAPWPLTLPQVTFGIVMANVFCLYYFAVKGWMR